MKTLVLFFGIVAATFGQWSGTMPGTFGQVSPDCVIIGSGLTATGRSPVFDNRKLACNTWVLSYSVSGASGVSVELDTANDANGIPGSWSAFAPVTGSNPGTSTTTNQATFAGYQSWVSVNVGTLTGSAPNLAFVAYGWRVQPNSTGTVVSASSLTSSSANGAAITEKGPRWSVSSSPAAGSQATASKAAGGAGVRHVADCISFSASAATAPVATALSVNLRDGATGAGTVIWTYTTAAAASTGELVLPHSICGLAVVGTANTAMTVEFSAGLANLVEAVNITGYDVQ